MSQNEEKGIFAPNHYCVHHGGVERNGSIEMAEAVSHNYSRKLGKVTHYDMKFSDGFIMENVAFEDIQVTNASLAEEHHSHAAKRDDEEKNKKGKKGGEKGHPKQRTKGHKRKKKAQQPHSSKERKISRDCSF